MSLEILRPKTICTSKVWRAFWGSIEFFLKIPVKIVYTKFPSGHFKSDMTPSEDPLDKEEYSLSRIQKKTFSSEMSSLIFLSRA